MIRRVVSYVSDDQNGGQTEIVETELPREFTTATVKGRTGAARSGLSVVPATAGNGSGGSGIVPPATVTTVAPAPVPAPVSSSFDFAALMSQQFGPFTVEQWLLLAAAGAAVYFLFFNKKR